MLIPSVLSGSGVAPLLNDVPPVLNQTSRLSRDSSESSDDNERLACLLAAVVALQSSLDTVVSLDVAGSRVATTLCNYLPARRVFVLWRPRPVAPIRLIGDSQGAVESEQIIEAIVAASEEIAARGTVTRWPPTAALERHALLTVVQMTSQLSAQSILAVTLSDDGGTDHGVLVVVDPDPSASESFLRGASIPLTSSLSRIARFQPSTIERIIRDVSVFVKGRHRSLLVTAAGLLLVLMCMPLRYRVSATVELQPSTRRFISVPFDGPLHKVAVQPGDMVEAGELLAAISPREIEFELAGQMALWNQADQERKSKLSQHDFAGSQLAKLEAERLQHKTELLKHQRDHLEIRSPIAGVVVSGDLTQSEGMTVTRGQTLMEIAPLGKMFVEIAVPETDIAEVRLGMDVQYSVNAYPGRRMHGNIIRIHPSAELREHENVFVALVDLNDPDGLYRPGMRGRAVISGDRHPLAWNLFHRAFYSVRQWLGW